MRLEDWKFCLKLFIKYKRNENIPICQYKFRFLPAQLQGCYQFFLFSFSAYKKKTWRCDTKIRNVIWQTARPGGKSMFYHHYDNNRFCNQIKQQNKGSKWKIFEIMHIILSHHFGYPNWKKYRMEISYYVHVILPTLF